MPYMLSLNIEPYTLNIYLTFVGSAATATTAAASTAIAAAVATITAGIARTRLHVLRYQFAHRFVPSRDVAETNARRLDIVIIGALIIMEIVWSSSSSCA